MRTALLPVFLLPLLGLAGGCDEDETPGSPAGAASTAKCKVQTESTTLAGNAATYKYTYAADGNLSKMDKLAGGASQVLLDTVNIGGDTVVVHRNVSEPQRAIDLETRYEGSIFDGFPARAELAVTERGVTKTNQNSYFFFYAATGQLTKVGQQTDLVQGDNEYDLTIAYDDRGNVTSLTYELTTGPRGTNVFVASGYDDKPNPFTGVTNWYRVMRASWNNYDPEPIFTALSKNNLLGYVTPDGSRRETTYAYNEHGFPIRRSHTNTNAGGTATFEETFVYECQ
jgi:YD repeat-containing protein